MRSVANEYDIHHVTLARIVKKKRSNPEWIATFGYIISRMLFTKKNPGGCYYALPSESRINLFLTDSFRCQKIVSLVSNTLVPLFKSVMPLPKSSALKTPARRKKKTE